MSSPERDGQFMHIKKECARFEEDGPPIISVDCKKKEVLGNFKNNGREWQPTGQPLTVNVYDFLSLGDGKAIPYGVYEVLRNTGFVNVGQDHDTAAFAVESIRRRRYQPVSDKDGRLRRRTPGSPSRARGGPWRVELCSPSSMNGHLI